MSDNEAKKLIENLLEDYTPGSILHLLGAVLLADEAKKNNDSQRHDQLKIAENALFVFGLGLDSSLP